MINIRKIAYLYLVDHNPAYLLSLRRSIENIEAYQIETFTSGEKFISSLADQKFRKNDIVIVFLGYRFFDESNSSLMNGIEILESIKVINRNIEVIMLAGENESEFGSYVLRSGAYSFIPKNENIFLRINNIIMKLISQKRLMQKKHTLNISFRIWLGYLILAILASIIYAALQNPS